MLNAQKIVLPVLVVKQINAFHVKHPLNIYGRISNVFLPVLMDILIKRQVAKGVQTFMIKHASNALEINLNLLLEI